MAWPTRWRAWFVRHPGFEGLRAIFAEMLGSSMGPPVPGVATPNELLDALDMLAHAGRNPEAAGAAVQEGEQRGCQEAASGRPLTKARRRLQVHPPSAGLVRYPIGRKTASPPMTPSRWKNGACVVLDASSLEDVLGDKVERRAHTR